MTDKQPDALMLADELDNTLDIQQRARCAAAELRRLHEENETLKAERDKLLAAAKKLSKELEDLRDSDEYWARF